MWKTSLLVLTRYRLTNRKQYKRRNNIVWHEFLQIRRTRDYI